MSKEDKKKLDTTKDIQSAINCIETQLHELCKIPAQNYSSERDKQLEIRIHEIKLLKESLSALSLLIKVKLEYESTKNDTE